MNDISTEENIEIAQHTEYRDPKIWLGVICLGITVLGLAYFVLIRKTEVESIEPVSRMPANETRNDAEFEYRIEESMEPDSPGIVIEVPAAAVGEINSEDISESDAPLVVYQASGSGSLRETPLYTETNTTLSREAQMEQVREMMGGVPQGVAAVPGGNEGETATAGYSGTGVRSLSYDKQHGYDPVSPYQVPDQANVLIAGTIVPAVLDFAIDSSLSGQIRAFTTEHVYAADGSTLLLPKSSLLLGQYSGGVVQGDTRVFFRWERIQIANGIMMDIDTAGLDAIGRSGIAGDVDERFFHKFGAAILLSVIESELEDDEIRINDLSANVSSDLESVISEIVRRRSAIPPVIRVPQGQRINVFVNQDIDFTAFLQQ